MQAATLPLNEPQRLEALQALDALDTESEFDALVKAGTADCDEATPTEQSIN